jgi:hypothetical protein
LDFRYCTYRNSNKIKKVIFATLKIIGREKSQTNS